MKYFEAAPDSTVSRAARGDHGMTFAARIKRFSTGIAGWPIVVGLVSLWVLVAVLAFSVAPAFAAQEKPEVSGEAPASVAATSVTISGQINPGEEQTTYFAEYGASTSYGFATSTASAGAGTTPEQVRIGLTGLTPGTTYHARIVATNALGTTTGEDITFLTPVAVAGSPLPDGRAYELVSPNASADGNVYVQKPFIQATNDLGSVSPFRSSANGDSVAFLAEALPTGGSGSTGEGFGDEFRATRTATGWEAIDIMAPRKQVYQYEGFSADLSVGALTLYEQPTLTSEAPEGCTVMYLRTAADEAFRAAFTSTQTLRECGTPEYAGVSEDDAHVLFTSEAALTSNAYSGATENLYESVAGVAYLVSVLPNGRAATNATFGTSHTYPGAVNVEPIGANLEHVVSPDGNRIVWTDLDTESGPENPAGTTRLFLRENAESVSAKTVQIDAAVGGGGQYRGANVNDTLIYFTKEEKLYQYNVATSATTNLTPSGGVVGLAGMNADGTVVYPVTSTVLTAEPNANGEIALSGTCELATEAERESSQLYHEELIGSLLPGRDCNLYSVRVGESPRFVATLMPIDNYTWGAAYGTEDYREPYGAWKGDPGFRTSETSQEGDVLAFTSHRQLTSYNNHSIREIYVYDADSSQLVCASCDPSGAPPSEARDAVSGRPLDEIYPPTPSAINTYQYRWLSGSGNRVFFDTAAPLDPQASAGIESVYEWERAGEGSCRMAPGCVYLLSGAESTSESFFSDASEDGNDVFFTSRTDLTPEDMGENVVLYDARVGGGLSQVTHACTGTGCQGVSSTAPTFATPPSVTFNGSGNYPSSSSTKAIAPKKKTAAQIKAEKLKRALKQCKKDRSKAERKICEASARRKYGAAKKTKKSTHGKEGK
jgi:hypothetical protein